MKPNFLFLWILLSGTLVSAQVSFKAVPDKTSAKVGEKIQLSFIVTTSRNVDIMQINFPGFAGFQMLGRNSRESFNYSDGRTTRQVMETVILVPQKEGRITVNPATILVDGKRIESNTVTFNIGKADVQRQNQNKNVVFMQIDLSKNEVYPNETLIAEVKLFARSFDALRRRSEIEVPGMSDFQVVQLSKNQERDFEQVSVNNQVYISEKIAEFQLTPKSTGDLVIPPFSLRVAVPLDFFEEKIIPVSTAVRTIRVNDFPDQAPATFNGAVGNFRFATHIDKSKLGSNESLNYEIELIGEGNFSSIQLPKINVPDEVEIYPPKTRNAFQTTTSGERGKLVDSYVLVPQYGGEFKIPSVEFTFFNPENGSYETISTKPTTIEVSGESRNQMTAAKQADSIAKADTIADNAIKRTIDLIPDLPGEIKNIFKSEEANKAHIEVEESENPWWLLLAVIPFLGLSWWLMSKGKKKKKPVRNPNHISQVFDNKLMLRNDLSDLRILAVRNDLDAFLKLNQKILNNIVVYFNKEQRLYDVVEARKILSEMKSDGFAHRWEQLYNEVQIMNYGIADSESSLMKQFETTESLIKELLK